MSDAETKATASTRLRALLFIPLALAIGVALIAAMTWWVIGSAPRSQAVAIADGVAVAEFAILPDDDAYPAALAIAADGALYSGSYQTGALWAISPEGHVREIPESRERVGSVTGLDLAPDGALYILDRIEALAGAGAIVWTYADGELTSLFEIPYESFPGGVLPDDIAVDRAGRIYISDRLGHVLRYRADGAPLGEAGGAYWWHAPCSEQCEITGLAYDPVHDDLLIAYPAADDILRVAELSNFPLNWRSILRERNADHDYGFYGLAATPAGEVYIALLNWNRIARADDGALVMLARDFRGASDVAYDPARNRLYVSNWNQFSLAFGTRPQLPFAIDVIHLPPAADAADA